MAAGLPPDPPLDTSIARGQAGLREDAEVVHGTLALLREAAGKTVAELAADAAFTGTFAQVPAVRMAVNGESHAKGQGVSGSSWNNGSTFLIGPEPAAWAHLLSAGRLEYVYNAAVGSSSTADALTRTSAIAATSPDVVVHIGGTYETDPANAQGIDFAEWKTNIADLVAAYRGMGAVPVLSTVPPMATTEARMKNIEQFNLWLRNWCPANGVRLIDVHRLTVNPATGGFLAAYDLDGIHLNPAGNKVVGQALASLLADLVAPYQAMLPEQATYSHNLLANGLFLSDSNADGLANGWSKAGLTPSLITGDTTIMGNWQRFADAGAGQEFAAAGVSAGWSVGDRLAICGRFRHVRGTSVKSTRIQLNFTNGSPNSIRFVNLWDTEVSGTEGQFYWEMEVPTGTTAISFNVYREAGTQGNGYTEIAQFGLYNLTTLAAA